MVYSWRNCGFALVILLSSAIAGLAQDLDPTNFLERNTSGGMGGAGVGGAGVGGAGAGTTSVPVGLQMDVQLSSEYNSNVTLGNTGNSSSGSQSKADLINEAQVGFSEQWSPTRQSQLTLAVNVGYQMYLKNTDMDGVTMNLPSALSYTFYTGDVNWTLHNSLSVSNNPSNQPALSSIEKFNQIADTAGVDAAWAAGSQLTLTAGYDFTISSSSLTSSGTSNSTAPSTSSSPEYASNSLNLGAFYALAPSVQLGFAASLADTSYLNQSGTDSIALSAGPFFHASLTPATEVFATAGVQSINVPSNNQGWYADLKLANHLNRIYSQMLEVSRTLSLGLISDTVTLNTVQYSGVLALRRDVNITANIFFENGQEEGGSIQEKFDYYGGGLTLQVQLSRSITAALAWQYNAKASDVQGRDYNQNIASLSLSWMF